MIAKGRRNGKQCLDIGRSVLWLWQNGAMMCPKKILKMIKTILADLQICRWPYPACPKRVIIKVRHTDYMV